MKLFKLGFLLKAYDCHVSASASRWAWDELVQKLFSRGMLLSLAAAQLPSQLCQSCLSHQSHQQPCNYSFYNHAPVLFLCFQRWQPIEEKNYKEYRKEEGKCFSCGIADIPQCSNEKGIMNRSSFLRRSQVFLSYSEHFYFWTQVHRQGIGSMMWLELYTHSSGGISTSKIHTPMPERAERADAA